MIKPFHAEGRGGNNIGGTFFTRRRGGAALMPPFISEGGVAHRYSSSMDTTQRPRTLVFLQCAITVRAYALGRPVELPSIARALEYHAADFAVASANDRKEGYRHKEYKNYGCEYRIVLK